MIFTKINPKDTADAMYVLVKNGTTGTLSNGDVVIWDATADDGITVNTTTTIESPLVAGVIVDTIPSGEYGRMQIYGFHPAVKIDGGTTDVAANTVLGTGGMAKYAYTNTAVGRTLGVALEGVTSVSTGKVFIRCM